MASRRLLERQLRRQADACERLGSPLYAELLARAAGELAEGEIVWAVLQGHEEDPSDSALALRLMGAVHRLVLGGEAPELAAHYPSAGGRPHDPWPAFRAVLERHAAELRTLVENPVQTNEPGRCAALLGGFLEVARQTGLPLRLLEVGASAGLNLRFDRYRYELGRSTWGPPNSLVRLSARVSGRPPPGQTAQVVSREGCDARPLDPATNEGRLTLASYVWADQPERLFRLRAACELAAETPAPVQLATAADWIEDRLRQGSPGAATVVFHSIVLQYLSETERGRLTAALLEAGEGAGLAAPLAWLQMEPAGELTDVHLTLWPGGRRCLIARAGYHGDPVEWVEASTRATKADLPAE